MIKNHLIIFLFIMLSSVSYADNSNREAIYNSFVKNFPIITQACGETNPSQHSTTIYLTDNPNYFYAYHNGLLTYTKFNNNHFTLIWCANTLIHGNHKVEPDNTFIKFVGGNQFGKVVGKLPKYRGYLKQYSTIAQQAFIECLSPSGKSVFIKRIKSEMGLSDPIFVDFKCP